MGRAHERDRHVLTGVGAVINTAQVKAGTTVAVVGLGGDTGLTLVDGLEAFAHVGKAETVAADAGSVGIEVILDGEMEHAVAAIGME